MSTSKTSAEVGGEVRLVSMPLPITTKLTSAPVFAVPMRDVEFVSMYSPETIYLGTHRPEPAKPLKTLKCNLIKFKLGTPMRKKEESTLKTVAFTDLPDVTKKEKFYAKDLYPIDSEDNWAIWMWKLSSQSFPYHVLNHYDQY